MLERTFVACTLAASLVAMTPPATAQSSAKVARIGYLATVSAATVRARADAFREGLRELGDVEGKNIAIEWRYADGKPQRIPALAAELVRLNVDAIVTAGPADTKAAKDATKSIPIIMSWDSDPIGNGFVANLAHPGGNITGLSTLTRELNGKQIELLKETIAKLSRVAVIASTSEPGNAQAFRELETAAGAFKVQLQYLNVDSPKDFASAFQSASKAHAGAAVVLMSIATSTDRKLLAETAAKNRVPVIYPRADFVEDGGFMSYGPSFMDLSRRAATYVDKILKGTKPADLPVEQPVKFELLINLKAAKRLGLTIPSQVLVRADRVIQ